MISRVVVEEVVNAIVVVAVVTKFKAVVVTVIVDTVIDDIGIFGTVVKIVLVVAFDDVVVV